MSKVKSLRADDRMAMLIRTVCREMQATTSFQAIEYELDRCTAADHLGRASSTSCRAAQPDQPNDPILPRRTLHGMPSPSLPYRARKPQSQYPRTASPCSHACSQQIQALLARSTGPSLSQQWLTPAAQSCPVAAHASPSRMLMRRDKNTRWSSIAPIPSLV
jgi:hypothetical protein